MIVNPASAGGRTAALVPGLRSRFPEATVLMTSRPGEALQLARTAVAAGAQTIVAVGGDGTVNEVVNGLLDEQGRAPEGVRLALIPSGSGSDLQRSLGIPSGKSAAAALASATSARSIDVMRVRYTSANGQPGVRFSLNITSFGLGGAVAERASRLPGFLGGRPAFLMATLICAIRSPGSRVEIRIDGRNAFAGRITNVAVGNGRYHGGGMLVCPEAQLDDGLMDLTVIEHRSLPQLVVSLPHLYDGRIRSVAGVQVFRATQFEASASDHVSIEIDGEPVGTLPLEMSILPGVLNVVVPQNDQSCR